jgi:hypothetical protein
LIPQSTGTFGMTVGEDIAMEDENARWEVGVPAV